MIRNDILEYEDLEYLLEEVVVGWGQQQTHETYFLEADEDWGELVAAVPPELQGYEQLHLNLYYIYLNSLN